VWEYSRLAIEYNVLSKRKLIALVDEGHVRGWDDPRLLSISGLRRRGISAAALNEFCEGVGVTRNANSIPWHVLEHHVRNDLAPRTARAFCVVDPLKVTLINFPEGQTFDRTIPNHPSDESFGTRTLTVTSTVYIERSDFRLEDDKKYFGLAPNKTVHLKYGYNITCVGHTLVNGEVTELQCTIDLESTVKAKGKLHWAPADALRVELRLYERLFDAVVPGHKDSKLAWRDELNPNSETIMTGLADHSVRNAQPGTSFQFERVGYFVVDQDSSEASLVFNRTCSLKMTQANASVVKR
jgi:glutaminyl-tRNA synthetase